MAKSIVRSPVPVPRLIPSVVNADPAVLARESAAHAEAILRQGDQTAAAAALATAAGAAAVSGRRLGRQVFIGPGAYTYTPTPGTSRVVVRMCGGGGGGGGAAGGANVACGAGGTSGVTIELDLGIASANPGSGVAGAGGDGGTAAGGNGAPGNATTLTLGGTTYTAAGGGGGGGRVSTPGNNSALVTGPVAGSTLPPTATYLSVATGTAGYIFGGAAAFPGDGGGGVLGIGGLGSHLVLGVGGNAFGFGGGGGGANAGAVGFVGGSGTPGIVIIEEYS